MNADHNVKIEIRDLTMAYGSFVVMRDINARIKRGEIFVIMGGSGCGKSTLLRHMIGLKEPARGDVWYDGIPFWGSGEDVRQQKLRSFGVLFQGGALWSSMTLAENIGLLLAEYTDLSTTDITDIVKLKLALVGLRGFEDYYPSEISGGMCKRAGLARALSLDPEILFFDEPSAGLDPISSRNLDELMLQLRDSLGATFVVVTHELASIFTIADDSVFLDPTTRTMRAQGNPRDLLKNSTDPAVREFLKRGEATAEPVNGKPDK
jgi:phospholipid/cholesterol/gamma-HCH transport system ATP-binding protein